METLPPHTEMRPAVPTWRDPSGSALTIHGVERVLGGRPVLRGINLEVPAGTVMALLGPSGCGKTTLLRCIAGLDHLDAGMIAVDNFTLSGPDCFVAPERRRIGMVFQEPALFPNRTVGGNVGYGLPRAERRGLRVDRALALVGLTGTADRTPATLSGGQQQRVALARALAVEPSLMLFDEPFSALDAPLRTELRGEVRHLLAATGATAMFVTHDQEEAFLIGDQVALMLEGRIAQVGTPADLYERPASRAVARFVGDANILPAVASGAIAETPVGRVPLAHEAHGNVEVVVRPECIVAREGNDAVVERIEYYGHDAVLVLSIRGCPVRCRVMGHPPWSAGDRVALEYVGEPTVAFEPAERLTTT